MVGATRQLLEGPWAGGGARSVYADFNALTLDITIQALFGTGLPAGQAAQVTGSGPARAPPVPAFQVLAL